MNSPDMHLQAAGQAGRACDTCGTLFTPKRAWARFCKTYGNRCHTAFHTAEARLEKVRLAGPSMYDALREIAGMNLCVAGGSTEECCPHCIALKAIKDLKPTESPKALLEKAKA